MAPRVVQPTSNADRVACCVQTCGALEAKSWLFQTGEEGERRWMCKGSSSSAHRTMRKQGEWQEWQNGEKLPPARAWLAAPMNAPPPAPPPAPSVPVAKAPRYYIHMLESKTAEENKSWNEATHGDLQNYNGPPERVRLWNALRAATLSAEVTSSSSVIFTIHDAPGQPPLADSGIRVLFIDAYPEISEFAELANTHLSAELQKLVGPATLEDDRTHLLRAGDEYVCHTWHANGIDDSLFPGQSRGSLDTVRRGGSWENKFETSDLRTGERNGQIYDVQTLFCYDDDADEPHFDGPSMKFVLLRV
jgi:hypothetical protein